MFMQLGNVDIRNSRGPRTVPCGTPEFTVIDDDLEPLIITVCSLPIRKSWIHWCKGPEMPKNLSF